MIPTIRSGIRLRTSKCRLIAGCAKRVCPTRPPLTVKGNKPEIPEHPRPGSLERLETERFLFYDGLVPTPDYVRCQRIDGTLVSLRNRANFDIRQLFLVDRRTAGKVGFASLDRKDKA